MFRFFRPVQGNVALLFLLLPAVASSATLLDFRKQFEEQAAVTGFGPSVDWTLSRYSEGALPAAAGTLDPAALETLGEVDDAAAWPAGGNRQGPRIQQTAGTTVSFFPGVDNGLALRATARQSIQNARWELAGNHIRDEGNGVEVVFLHNGSVLTRTTVSPLTDAILASPPVNLATGDTLTIAFDAMGDNAGDQLRFRDVLLTGTLSGGESITLQAENGPNRALSETAPPDAPNILFVVFDDLNTDVGTYGNHEVLTPNRLAEEGMVFERAYANGNFCVPSRHSFLSGTRRSAQRPWHLQSLRDEMPDAVTLPQRFRHAGYHVIGIGKIYHDERYDDPESFDILYRPGNDTQTGGEHFVIEPQHGHPHHIRMGREELEYYRDIQAAERAVRFIEEDWQREQPFFIALGIVRPHTPYRVPKSFFEKYDPAALTLDPVPDGWIPPNQYTLNSSAPQVLSEADRRELVRGYYASVTFGDYAMGLVIEHLREQQLLDETLVCVVSDHGYQLGDHRYYGKHNNLENVVQIPMIWRYPPVIEPGTRTPALAELVDLYPTLTSMAGISAPDYLEGANLEPVLRNPRAEVRQRAYGSILRVQNDGTRVQGLAVRTSDERRFVKWMAEEPAYELYRLRMDPWEYDNHAGSAPAQETSLLEELLMEQWQMPAEAN